MNRIIPQSFYDDLEKDFKSSHLGEFKFTEQYLSNVNYSHCNLSIIFDEYYPDYLNLGMYKPFKEITELREFGEQLIALQSSPLWKALK